VSLLVLQWLLLKASLFSTGGFGNLPLLRHDLIPRGWATERNFAEALSVGQITPGPNGLWVVGLGYFVAGWRGALMAVVAICIPPLFVLLVERVYRRVKHHPAIEGFVLGLSLAVIGVFTVVLFQMLMKMGLDTRTLVILAASVGLGLIRRLPMVAIIAAAGLTGYLWR
jgi:chromate transporter